MIIIKIVTILLMTPNVLCDGDRGRALASAGELAIGGGGTAVRREAPTPPRPWSASDHLYSTRVTPVGGIDSSQGGAGAVRAWEDIGSHGSGRSITPVNFPPRGVTEDPGGGPPSPLGAAPGTIIYINICLYII